MMKASLVDERPAVTHQHRSSRATRRSLLAAGAALALIAAAHPARAAGPAPAQLSPQDKQDVQRVQDYLNGIKSLQSRFQQVAGDGATATGTIYLARPGNMRIVYDPPSMVLVVANSGQIHYYDKALQQVTETYTENTPAWFLLRNNIRLNGDVTVVRFAHQADVLRITLVETDHPDAGEVTLTLSDHPLELRQWTVVDAQQKTVTVTLDDPHYGVPVNPELFYWQAPQTPAFGK
jgi:outer membrane lipoprotein-sorting protein